METMSNLLVAVDAGHGGYDSGVSHMGRTEKNDNLDLAIQLQRELTAQGINTIMTRMDDSFVSLEERVRIANAANADLFISLHRSSYMEQTETPNSVEGIIHLTAPEELDGFAAARILEEFVRAGAENSREVRREDYHVLKATVMPSILLKIGSAGDEAVDMFFYKSLRQYAMLITRGVIRYFDLARRGSLSPISSSPVFPEASFQTEATSPPNMSPPVLCTPLSPLLPPVILPHGSVCDITGQRALTVQRAINRRYGWGIAENSILDYSVRSAVIMSMQVEINNHHNRGLAIDGKLNDHTTAAIPTIAPTSPDGFIFILQAVLMLNGYDPGSIDGRYGENMRMAVQRFQRDFRFAPTGIVEPEMLILMLEASADISG